MLSKVLIMKTTQTPPRMDDNKGAKIHLWAYIKMYARRYRECYYTLLSL
jgi:hypothetical protein